MNVRRRQKSPQFLWFGVFNIKPTLAELARFPCWPTWWGRLLLQLPRTEQVPLILTLKPSGNSFGR